MRPLPEQNFYEILEIPIDATKPEIDRAYRIALATYEPTSLATYSIFSAEEAADIMRRVEEAYIVLSDQRMRREYDMRLRRESAGERRVQIPDLVARPAPRGPERADGAPLPRRSPVELEESLEPAGGVFDGAALRRIRMSQGVELDEVCSVTKIGKAHLHHIETNRYPERPAPVYLRGFLREYARFLRLDPQRVADTYMARYAEAPGSAP